MSSPDRNFKSYYPESGDVSDQKLFPSGPDWPAGSWSDTVHFSRCAAQKFVRFEIGGGKEDCIDLNNNCNANLFSDFKLWAVTSSQAITLKGGSCDNEFEDLVIVYHGKNVDIEIGNWSDQGYGDNTRNVFYRVKSEDGKPVTYCYRLGSKPRFIDSNVKHLWWRSIGITIYWYAKLIWMGIRG